MGVIGNIAKGTAKFGIIGTLDQAMSGVFMQGLKGTWGVVSGTFKGIAGMEAGLHNASLLGKVTGGIGYTAGRVIGAPIKPIGGLTFKAGKTVVKSIPHDVKRAFEVGNDLYRSLTKVATDGDASLGAGLFGRRLKSPVAHAVGIGALGLGAMGAMENDSYNLGLRTAVNGVMNYENVSVTQGSVNPTFTPIHRKPINNHGADANLVFAMHNKRNG